ncbi:MAG TPA: biopolymer transporter ExbD [Longimicrobium sp.]|nr:biopolymer transporter ExbD [Longimicrobium sp.]
MAMSVGSRRGGMTAQINVTPMIDVLLVLLIIFMVVQAGLRKGIALQVPPAERESVTPPGPDALVLRVEGGGRYRINRRPVTSALEAEVARIFAGRPRKVLFVEGAETATYGEVIRAADAARAAGVEVLGLVPRRTAAGAS